MMDGLGEGTHASLIIGVSPLKMADRFLLLYSLASAVPRFAPPFHNVSSNKGLTRVTSRFNVSISFFV